MILALSAGLSGLLAATRRAEIAAGNIANAGSNGPPPAEGAPPPAAPGAAPRRVFQPDQAVQSAVAPSGTRVEAQPRAPGFVPAYDPTDPAANAEGLVATPDV